MVRKSMEEQTEKLRSDILSKLSCAQENRDDHLRTIMAKLQVGGIFFIELHDGIMVFQTLKRGIFTDSQSYCECF